MDRGNQLLRYVGQPFAAGAGDVVVDRQLGFSVVAGCPR